MYDQHQKNNSRWPCRPKSKELGENETTAVNAYDKIGNVVVVFVG